MKSIETTPIWNIVSKIINQSYSQSRSTLIVKLHTKEKDITCHRLLTLDTVRDYAHKLFDYNQIKLMIPLGDFVYDVYPYRQNLEVSIYKREINPTTNTALPNNDILLQRYKAVYPTELNNEPVGSELSRIPQYDLNIRGFAHPVLQLLDRQVEPTRIITIGGTVKKSTYSNIIKLFVSQESSQLKIDGRNPIEAIDIVEPDNNEIQSQTVIPYGIKLTGLSTYIQEKLLGLYNAGLGTYLQRYKNRMTWFVYPLFKTKRLNTRHPNAIFYLIPKERFNSSEFTYIEEGNTTHILIVGNREFSDSAEVDFMDLGNGVRLTDASQFMTKPIEITEDGPIARRRKLNLELLHVDREDGLNYAPVSGRAISANNYVEFSKVLARSGSTINLSWHNSLPDNIYPGMNCKVAYLEDDKVKYRTGVIIHTHSFSTLIGENINNNIHQTSTAISIFLEKGES